jgi:hypothetical protein
VAVSFVAGDEAYGLDPVLRARLRQRGVGHALSISRNQRIQVSDRIRCWSPRPVPLTTLITVVGRRWAIEEAFQAALCGCDPRMAEAGGGRANCSTGDPGKRAPPASWHWPAGGARPVCSACWPNCYRLVSWWR